METFDVLVVGAGPAGSTAAYRLARGGASVLLADRARFPRDKPCGGGLTMRAVRQLPFPVDDGRDYGVALEANVPYGVVSRERYQGRLCLELANVPGGYGWVFPKGDHINVGVGGWEREGPRMREHLARFCREYSIPESGLESLRGYRLPLLHARARLAKGRLALLGDAAGLVDPLSGDGIYEALLSAKLAAGETLELLAGNRADLAGYDRDLPRAVSSQVAAAGGRKCERDRF